ncbi:response regulator transcription factor [Mucilaginibacter sp. CSA2-8R]|uniref:response regulator transcription factor n=1 Tax=Mucilaginibacter sp. CSA2-8R TaxID=3141542 RepID=UPI00315D4739
MKILLIDDEPKVAAAISRDLREQLHSVAVANDGSKGYRMVRGDHYDLIILDINVLSTGILEACKKIRELDQHLPIVMLSSPGGDYGKEDALKCGADEFLTKPVKFTELLDRVNMMMHREHKEQEIPEQRVYRLDDLELDTDRKVVTRHGRYIHLSTREFLLLELLMKNQDRVLSRAFIAETVWGTSVKPKSNVVDVYINYLRTKIDKGHSKHLIHTVTGMGYIFKKETRYKLNSAHK